VISWFQSLPFKWVNLHRYNVHTEHEVWKYIAGVFYPTLYGAATWDDDAAFRKSSPVDGSAAAADDWRTNHNNQPGWVMGGARIVGGARIGTVRVKPRFAGDNTCEIAPALGGYSDTNAKTPWKCFPPFQTKTNSLQWLFGRPDTEDNAEFGNGPAAAATGRWKFNRDGDEPGFMDYRTMTLYPAPGWGSIR
jgi:hypothetical protein